MDKFNKTKKMFNLGGAVGKNTQPNYGGFVGGMTRGYADGGPVGMGDVQQSDADARSTNFMQMPPEDAKREALMKIMGNPNPSPQDIQADRDKDQELMTGALGTIGKAPDMNIPALNTPLEELPGNVKEELQDALNRLKKGPPQRPAPSISDEQIEKNLSRLGPRR